jgi:hypothetical protein
MIEIVVALAILSLMAAITIPSVMHSIDMARVRDAATRLTALRDGIYDPSAGALAFSQKVGANPGRLSELTTAIVSGNPAVSPNSCGGSFSNGQRNNWAANGPFVKYAIDAGVGLGTAMGTIEDDLIRVPASAATGVLQMMILETDPNLVVMLDEELNAGDGSAAGSVQWSAPANGVTQLTFVVPINNKC